MKLGELYDEVDVQGIVEVIEIVGDAEHLLYTCDNGLKMPNDSELWEAKISYIYTSNRFTCFWNDEIGVTVIEVERSQT